MVYLFVQDVPMCVERHVVNQNFIVRLHYYPLTGLTISGETFQFYDNETTITTINALNTLLVKPYNVFITQSYSSS